MSENPLFDLFGPLSPIKGVSLGVAEAGIKQANHRDLLLIELDEGTKVSGVFTQNKFCAAPVIVAKEHILRKKSGSSIRALIINTGSANAGTGEEGITHTRSICTVAPSCLHAHALAFVFDLNV